MINNTYSLLNTPWMISESAVSSLYPQLLSLIKGDGIKEAKAEFPVIYMSQDDDGYYDTPELSSTSNYICVLAIKGPVYKYDQMCGPMGTKTMTRLLKEWEANDSVIGVVLDIDSPGGQTAGLSEFANFIYNYSKPTVSYTDGNECSAAEYIASACDFKIANQFAEHIGCIGTMLTYVNLEGILTEQGAIIKDIYASKSPRKNEEDRALRAGSDALVVKNILDPLRDNFANDMVKFRPKINPEVLEGAIYFPEAALEMGLIDAIGTMQDAFNKVAELSQIKKKSNNQNPTNMSKNLPKLQAVLGLETPLATTDKGSYLNAEQLDTVEAKFNEHETAVATLNTGIANEKSATTAANEKLTAANGTISGFETSVDAMIADAGLTATGTITEKMTALSAHVKVLGGKDGASSTNPILGQDNAPNAKIIGGIDVSAALNN